MAIEPRTPAQRLRSRVGSGFDGNLSDGPAFWWFIADRDYPDEEVVDSLLALSGQLIDGNVAWVIFPLEGFRL